MAITAEAPRGAILETLGGAERVLMLRLGEIERWEDKHGGVYDLADKLLGAAKPKPRSREMLDLVALGLVGGGMTDADADAIVESMGVADTLRAFQIARDLLAVALYPDIVDAPDMDDEGEKKTADG